MGGHLKAVGETVIHGKRYAVIARAVIGAEHGDIRRCAGQGAVGRYGWVLGYVVITSVLVYALLMLVIDVELPGLRERVLKAGAGLNCIRTVVLGIDDRALLTGAQQAWGCTGDDGPEGVHPSVLGQIIEIDSCAGANHGVAAVSRRIGKTQPRRERLAVVVGNTSGKRQSLSGNGQDRRVLCLIAAIGIEQTKRSVIAQAVIDCEVVPDAPGILRVEAQPLHLLRKAAIAFGDGLVCRVSQVSCKSARVGKIKAWIFRKSE